MCILFVHTCTLLKGVSCYDFSVLSMSVMGFQTSLDGVGGWVGGVLSSFIMDLFSFCKAPKIR